MNIAPTPAADPLCEALLTIDLAALADNWRLLAARVAPARVAAVVKADAYGLGAVPVVRALQAAGARDFFVAHAREAAEIAPVVGAGSRVWALNGVVPGGEAELLASGAIPVLNAREQLDRWRAFGAARGVVLPAALQFDSGMSRLGMPPEEVAALAADSAALAGIDLRLVMSHLACADDPASPDNAAQFARFAAMAARFPGVPRGLDNSGGAFLDHDHGDVIRAGLALYGGAPQGDAANPMRPVVRLDAPIAQVRTIAPGTGVGYGLTFRAERLTRVATVPVGYADGWPRALGNCGAAFIAGQRVPVIGRVSMDSLCLDVTGVDDRWLFPGARVELLGPHQTIEDVARDAGTIAYEILTRLGHRYRRVWAGDPGR